MTTSLDSLLDKETTGRHKGCAVCGESNAAAISVRIIALPITNGARQRSRMRSYCEQHAIEMWEAANALLEGKP